MTVKISTGLANSLLASASLKDTFNNAELRVYGGTEPSSADASIGAATLLYTIRGTGSVALAFADTASSGALAKSGAQTWEGTAVATGTATWCRLVQATDDGSLSTTAPRWQGDVGTAGRFLNVGTTSITSGAPQLVNSCSLAIPLQ